MAMQPLDYEWRNRHGFPQGYHYMPTPLELIDLLGEKLAGRPLPGLLSAIFHDVRIRGYNPVDLHEQYKEHEEAGFIYFFSEREFPKPGSANKRPARRTAKGGWKASGGSKAVRTTANAGGFEVGQQLTMVFYEDRFPDDKCPAKTDWAMHEFTKIIGPDNKLANMAIYRLYKMRSGKVKAKAGRCVDGAAAVTIPVADKPTMQAPLPPAMANNHEASTSQTAQAQARASIDQTHYTYPGKAFGAAPPWPGSWVMPVAATPPVQLQHAGNTSYISWPAPSTVLDAAPAVNYTPMPHHHRQQQQQQGSHRLNSVDWRMLPEMSLPPPPTPPRATLMASVSEPAALCPPPSSQQQQQAAGQLDHAKPGDWHMPQQMVLPPPPAPLMASVSEPAALCPPPSSQQQQQQQKAAGQLDYAKPGDWRMPPQMVQSPPPAPLMVSVSEPAALCRPPSQQQQQQQQQLGEQFSCPEHEDWDKQLLKNDLPPPLPPPAPAAREYKVDEFSAWYDMQQVSLPAEDPWFPMTDEDIQLCTFTMDELLGMMDEEPAPVTMVAEEADTNNQAQHSTQQEQLVVGN